MRYQCRSCETVIKEPLAFCPRCATPTAYASPDQIRDHEVTQWRRYTDGAAAPPEQAVATRTAEPAPVVHQPRPTSRPRRSKPKIEAGKHIGELVSKVAPKPVRAEPPQGTDSEFHYTACMSCENTDWLLRTGRNEDGTWRYWCVRCSRSFKTDALLRHGRKPFVAGGGILTALALLANFL